MAKIKNRKYIIGNRECTISGNSEQEIAEKYHRLRNELEGQAPGIATTSTDFCQYADQWYERKAHRVGKTTAINERGRVNHLQGFFKGYTIQQIKWRDVQQYLDTMKGSAQSTVKQKLLVLQQILDEAVSDELIHSNQARNDHLHISSTGKTRREAVPMMQYKAFLKRIPEITHQPARMLAALTAYTGMRRGEALALRWESINWTKNTIAIDKAVAFDGNYPYLKGPKSESGNRTIPLVEGLRNVLRPVARNSGFIISEDGKTLLTEHRVMHCLRIIRRQAGLDNHYGLHSLRHTVATVLANHVEIPMKVAQCYLGHADISTTMNTYAEGDPDAVRNAGIIFSNVIS